MVYWSMITAGNITPSRVKSTISDLTHQGLNGVVIVQHSHIVESLKEDIVNIYLKCKIESLNNEWQKQKAVQVPELVNGVDCKSIIRRFESCPALKIWRSK